MVLLAPRGQEGRTESLQTKFLLSLHCPEVTVHQAFGTGTFWIVKAEALSAQHEEEGQTPAGEMT